MTTIKPPYKPPYTFEQIQDALRPLHQGIAQGIDTAQQAGDEDTSRLFSGLGLSLHHYMDGAQTFSMHLAQAVGKQTEALRHARKPHQADELDTQMLGIYQTAIIAFTEGLLHNLATMKQRLPENSQTTAVHAQFYLAIDSLRSITTAQDRPR